MCVKLFCRPNCSPTKCLFGFNANDGIGQNGQKCRWHQNDHEAVNHGEIWFL